MHIKILFNNLYWKRRYNTLDNKYQTEKDERKKLKDDYIALQKEHIATLNKVIDLDKDVKIIKKILGERKK